MDASSGFSTSLRARRVVGFLHQTNKAGDHVTTRAIFSGQDMIIGRDSSRWLGQYTVDDPYVSSKHCRIYTIIYDDENLSQVPPLVYAEDLSRNGTYWNRSLIGKGNGGLLLSDGDSVRLSSSTLLRFERGQAEDTDAFDLTQEEEMKEFRQDYTITDRLLGAGAFGKVYMAINEPQRRQVACKIVDLRKLRHKFKPKAGPKEQPASAEDVDSGVQLRKVADWAEKKQKRYLLEHKLAIWYREVEILASISHPNIIGLEKVLVTDNTLYIFQDLVTAGDLFSYLEKKDGRLTDVEAAVIVRQIVIALIFLHKNNIVHRDIKPDNILMTTLATGCRVVLTDFGAARRVENNRQRMTTLAGTAEYLAPEIQSGRPGVSCGYSKAVDMWSLGCVTVVLLTGGPAFQDPQTNQHSEVLAQRCSLIELKRSKEWSEVSARPKAFVEKLLLLEENERLTAEQALADPWFSNDFHKADFEDLYRRTIRHWQPKVHKKPIIEFSNARRVQQLPCSQEVLACERRSRGRLGQMPVEPPYKLFPKSMLEPLLPTRRSPKERQKMSDEVSAAINTHWLCSSGPPKPAQLQPSTVTKAAKAAKPQVLTLPDQEPSRTTPGKVSFRGEQENTENAGFSAFSSQHSRPTTPRPKPKHNSQILSMRILATTSSADHSHLLRSILQETKGSMQGAREREAESHDKSANPHAVLQSDERSNGQSAKEHKADLPCPVRANSSLRLRTPKSARFQPMSTSSSRKRRRSVYDLDLDEVSINSVDKPENQRPLWQTASLEASSPDDDGKEAHDREEMTLVTGTPSPTQIQKSLYLPRL